MFTGIIKGTGRVVSRRSSGGGLVFEFSTDFELDDPEEGESIAVNGVCLTAYRLLARGFVADVSPESLARTTLGGMNNGRPVNLERALRLSDRLGGHLVTGHIDCVGSVTGIDKEGDFTVIHFSVPNGQDRYIIEKGSIGIDGISLTVNSCSPGGFSVSIIPHTMKNTTLTMLRPGATVNVEVDIIGKYVEKLLTKKETGPASRSIIDQDYLAEKGFF